MAGYIPEEEYGFYTGEFFDPLKYEAMAQGKYAPDKDDPPKQKDKKDKKDKDKGKDDKGKDDEKPSMNITRQLVRNEDGTVGVQFIDMDTGRVVQNPYGERKDIWTAQTSLDDILKDANIGYGKGKKPKGGKDAPAVQAEIIGYDRKGRAIIRSQGGVTSYGVRADAPASFASKAPVGPVQGFTNPNEEQGDTTDNTYSDTYGYNDPAKDKDYQVDGKFNPTGIAERDFQAEVASNTRSNAFPTSISETDFQYSNGDNFSALDGTPHSEVNQTLSERGNWDEATIDKAARTLAGELPGNIDLSTPEGIAEARGILSTIENRDIANGPNKTAIDAITAPSQYSTWNNEKMANIANTNYSLRAEEFNKVVKDYLEDPNSNLGFTSYHAPYVNPAWSDDMQDVQEIGSHKFGTLPEYTSKMAKYQAPLTDEQSDMAATGQINQNFKQSFAYPAGYDLVNNQPQIDLTGVNDMATGVTAQRDYVAPTNSMDGFAKGVTAQRDYVAPQRIVEEAPAEIGTFNGTVVDPTATINNQVSMDNGFAIQQGNQIAGTPPSIDPGVTEVATRGLPSAIDIGGQVYTPDEGLSDGSISTPASRMTYDDPTSLDSRMSGDFAASPAGVYGDAVTGFGTTNNQALGFGDYVSVDPAAAEISAQSAQTQTGRINGLYENENTGMLSAANDISNSAPAIGFADSVESQTAASSPTSAGEGSSTTGVSTGVSSGPSGEGPGTANATDGGDSGTTSTTGTTGTSTSGGFVDADVEGDDGY